MIKSNSFILPLTQIRATDLPLVGGKGANLGELTHQGFPVPSGFCLSTKAFEQFTEACPQMEELYRLLESVTAVNLDTTRTIGQKVRQTLLDTPMPAPIIQAITTQWQQLGTEQAYAVRSSATAEDLPDASFAGQQDTYLNILGEAALLDAIKRCWVSLFTDRAILYRCQNQFDHREVALSVVVQQMVMAEISGTLFTADPLTGHRHTLTIDASFGLGEALVSGLVSPDAYRVDKRHYTILERHIAQKKIAIFPENDGGTRQETLSHTQQNQTVLTDNQILQLAQLGCQVEAHYGTPQDIEWAIKKGKLYLLQARPITSLYPINNLQSPDDSLHIYYSLGHQQMMTNTISPLGTSIMQAAMPIGNTPNQAGNSFAHSNGGRIFVDITLGLRHPILRKLIMKIAAQFNALAPESLEIAMARPEFQRPNQLHIPWSIRWGILHLLSRVISALWWQDLTGYVHRVDHVIGLQLQSVRATLNNKKTDADRIQAIQGVLSPFFSVILYWVPVFIAGMIAHQLLGLISRHWADPEDLEAYNLGVSGNAVTEMNLALGDLADIARQSTSLSTLFTQLGDNSQTWLTQARKLKDSDPFFEAWETFLANYGARGSAEIDIQTERWYEEPLPLLKVIASYLQKDAQSHRTQHQTLVQNQKQAVERLLNKAPKRFWGQAYTRLIHRLIHVSHEGGVLREHHKFLIVQMLRLIKETVSQVAINLTKAQKLPNADDIWYLSLYELHTLCQASTAQYTDLITSRQANFARFAKMTPPLVLTSDGESPMVSYKVKDAPEGALVGQPVSAGIYEGVVRVIHNPQTETLNVGEILVASFTDPGWTPLFINAGALIMEVGGVMTHGSVVAREYGIPAIVGVHEATKRLQTGQHIRINGNRGIIEVLSP